MMGPLLTYGGDAHLERLLVALRASYFDIWPDKTVHGTAFWFRRGWGLVHGSCRATEALQPTMYFGFGHPFNPLLWSADGRVLKELERVFLANGSSPVDLATRE